VQALVLAGGEGTRLRPLTLATPKPVMPFAGRPFMTFMLDWLARHGMDDVILSCGFMSDAVESVLGDMHAGMRLRYVHEDEPLGTAGPLRLALDTGALKDERLFVLNGDVLTDMDLTAEREQHERTGARATLCLVAVDDTESYGVVPTKDDGEVEAFLEKSPGPAPTNRINAGAYLLEREVIEQIPSGRAVSIEREIFPSLVGNGLYGYLAAGYWMDVGTPRRYLEGTWDLLAGVIESTLPERDVTGSLVYEGGLTSGAHIGPQAVVGHHCSVGSDSSVERAVLHDRVAVGADCALRECIVAEGARIGDGAEVRPGAVIGKGARVAAGAVIEEDARVQPGEEIG
jgi:mannose-1-phosphate guanylyltransferase